MDASNPEPDFSQGAAWVAGKYLPVGQASIPLTDWGFLRSDAAYDVVTVWDGAFFRLHDHLQRFRASCKHFRLDPGRSDEEIAQILTQCVRLSGLRHSYVEMIVTRGQPPWGSRDPRQAVNQFLAFAVPYVWIANEAQRQRGLHLRISEVVRIPPSSVDARAKNYHWHDLTQGLLGALDEGADTVVLGDGAGNIVEGPGFNVFAVDADGAITTPGSGVLEGITRRTVMEIARAQELTMHEGNLPAAALRSAREVFVTSSAGGVLAVTQVDGKPVGDGHIGSLTRRITQAYWDAHKDPRLCRVVDYAAPT